MKRGVDSRAGIFAALAAFTVVGVAIRCVVVGQDLFADELATYWIISTHGLGGVVDTVSTTAEITPPLGFMLAWLGSKISLDPEFVRLSALIAGTATIPLVYAVGARTVGRGAALAAAALTALSPFMIFYSAEARGYGVMMALVLLSTLALLLACDRGGARWWVLYAVCVALAAYTHYTSIFVLGGQFAWALWTQPQARKPLLISTALAAVAYIPWLSSFKGDLDSPTTDILSALSPFDFASAKLYLGHWSLGFPYGSVAGLRDVPGIPGLLLIGAGLLVGAYGLFSMRARLRAWFGAQHNRIVLVALLALITPAAEALQSLAGTNTFSTRNFAASWPFLALTVAALITCGERRLRIAAAALLVAGVGFGAAQMVSADNARPPFSDVAAFVADGPGGVVADAASLSPGPTTNFDVEGSDPGGEVFRLNNPAETGHPFGLGDPLPDPAAVAGQAVAAADGDPITVVTAVIPGQPVSVPAQEFIAALPNSYGLAETRTFDGFFDLKAQVFERKLVAVGSGGTSGSG